MGSHKSVVDPPSAVKKPSQPRHSGGSTSAVKKPSQPQHSGGSTSAVKKPSQPQRNGGSTSAVKKLPSHDVVVYAHLQ